MEKQYIISEKYTKKREILYDYIINNYDLKISYPYEKEKFVKSNFPFVIDFKKKKIWICESITCLSCASQCNRIININDFMKSINI